MILQSGDSFSVLAGDTVVCEGLDTFEAIFYMINACFILNQKFPTLLKSKNEDL